MHLTMSREIMLKTCLLTAGPEPGPFQWSVWGHKSLVHLIQRCRVGESVTYLSGNHDRGHDWADEHNSQGHKPH